MANATLYASQIGNVLYGGIDSSIPGHGGEKCLQYLDRNLMVLDTAIATAMMIIVFIFALKTYSFPQMKSKPVEPASKQVLLVILCLVLGVELGYKFSSKQVLYLLNPCHVITMAEIYLLGAKQSPSSMATLRLLIHYLYGALIAMVLPDTHARLLPFEVPMYWIQHALIFFIIPPYLVYTFGIESLEPLTEWAWSCFSGILFGIHHLYIMQPIAMFTQVNLNFILCPANSDPFNGPYYRLAAIFHQAFCLLTLGKIYSIALHFLIPKSKKKKH